MYMNAGQLADWLRWLRRACAMALLAACVVCAMPQHALANDGSAHAMYRLYNPYTGEHLYTSDKTERYAATTAGWLYEGLAWMAPDESSTPVFRLYNPYTGEHHYTVGAEERDQLVKLGWNDEGVGWYSEEGGIPVYRQYNPYEPAFNHNYTTGAEERDQLVKLGWNDEGVCWYASDAPSTLPTIRDLLTHALEPIGSTMYVYGGGWNDADVGAGSDACTIGLSPRWAEFASQQDSSYDYRDTMYWIHDGLDCTGYVGWVVYNTMEDVTGANAGYVTSSDRMAQLYAQYGWGTFTPASSVSDWKAGDIMCMEDHAWIVLGTCADGSVLFAHCSPQVVTLSGTCLPDGSTSDAIRLAQRYMSEKYPDWYERFPNCVRGYWYLTTSHRMRWSPSVLPDPDGLTGKSADEVIATLWP